MSIPNTNTFKLSDVTREIYGDQNAGRNLRDCFIDAVPGKFDASYGNKVAPNSMLEFRNYNSRVTAWRAVYPYCIQAPSMNVFVGYQSKSINGTITQFSNVSAEEAAYAMYQTWRYYGAVNFLTNPVLFQADSLAIGQSVYDNINPANLFSPSATTYLVTSSDIVNDPVLVITNGVIVDHYYPVL